MTGAFTLLAACLAASALRPPATEPLRPGAIRPSGWLKCELDGLADGLQGRLYEHPRTYLSATNAWRTGGAGHGWEEEAYWLRSFAQLAVLTRNGRCLDVARGWFEDLLKTARPDGWFGPSCLRDYRTPGGRVITDLWPHMVMCEAVAYWADCTGDGRFRKLVSDFFLRYCANLPDEAFIPSYGDDSYGWDRMHWKWRVQIARAGDVLPLLYRLHGETGDAAYLDVAERFYLRRWRPGSMYLHAHNVNFAQMIAYETVHSRLSGDESERAAADWWYDLHMGMWGQFPGGGLAGDEFVRAGCVDARYGTESCTWGEFCRSFLALEDATGEIKWADRTEEILFNSFPCAYEPGWRRLHYITAVNQVMLDRGYDHNYRNPPPMITYSDTDYPCCRHNAALAPCVFASSLVRRRDGGLYFRLYAPHEGAADVAGRTVAWTMETRYPFEEEIRLTLKGAKGVKLLFRIPGWADCLRLNGKDCRGEFASYRPSADEETVALELPSELRFVRWPRTGACSLRKGPLAFSLRIAAEAREADGRGELRPASPWNYALEIGEKPVLVRGAWDDDCFHPDKAPLSVRVKGRRLPAWVLQDHQPAAQQRSPCYTAEPLEELTFVPMGTARLRLGVLPVASQAATAERWHPVRPETKRSERPRDLQPIYEKTEF